MQAQRVIITIAGPPQLTSSEQWAQVWTGFSAQFPVRNLHWKPVSRTSIRTIQSLDASVVLFQTLKDEGVSQIPSSLLEKPLLNVFMVICDDNDTYKSTVKKQIKDWHSQIATRKCQEWLIVLISKVDGKQNQSGLMRMRGTLLDRIRADFNVDKRDRCVQFIWNDDYRNPATWAEVISKAKDGIISAFDQAVSPREDEIKRSELQKTMPGWNFCTFFLLKESLANSFEGANLPEDALIQFDELEASFFQVMKDKTLWFGKFVEPSAKDDSLPLLSLTKKAYRDLILANTISVFDIRVYLLARQCHLLAQMGRIVDIAKKAMFFLAAFGRRLREFEATLPDCFIESWLYSSALSVVDACDAWAKPMELDAATQSCLNAAKGELLSLARSQLDRIGIRIDRLPDEPPFCACAIDGAETDAAPLNGEKSKRISRRVTNVDIINFLDKPSSFYELYTRITNKAIDLFVKAGRRKFALRLHGSLAALDLHRNRYSTAHQTYTSLPAHYAPHRWSSMESYMLFQSIEAHKRMQGKSDRQWIQTALSFLKLYTEETSSELLYGVKDKDTYIRNLCESVIEAASTLDHALTIEDTPILCITPLVKTTRRAVDKDGYYLDINITNKLPCSVSSANIAVFVTGSDQRKMQFSSESVPLNAGTSIVQLFCPVPTDGTYIINKIEARIGAHLLLQWSFVPSRKRQSGIDPSTKLVKLPLDSRAVHVDIKQPLDVEIAGPSKISVVLTSGRNSLSRATLKISSADVSLDVGSGCITKGTCSLEFSTESVILSSVAEDSQIRLDIPHSRADGRNSIEIITELVYSTNNEPGIERRLSIKRIVPTALPLAVNVQDFFRGDCLLTHFTIMTTTSQYIRVTSVDLEPSEADRENLELADFNAINNSLIVTRHEPASFVFRLKFRGEVNDPLRLRVKYRVLRDEVEAAVTQRVIGNFEEHDGDEGTINETIFKTLRSDPTWADTYVMTGCLKLPELEDKDGEHGKILSQVQKVLQENRLDPESDSEWRQFTIPVDFPRLDILATAHLKVFAHPFDKEPIQHSKKSLVYTGQPVTATVTIHTSFQWAGRDRKDVRQYRMRYELQENTKDWLLSGQKRGDFMAKNDSIHKISITLMALRHGEIPLPDVLLTAFHSEAASAAPPTLETYQVHGSERLLVLPRSGKTTYMLNVSREQ